MKNDIKIILLSLSIIIIIFSSSLYLKSYLEKTTSIMLSEIDHLETYIKSNEWDKANDKIAEINNNWDQLEGKWNLLINHREIDEIAVALKNAKEYVMEKDKTETLSSISSLKHYISHIPEMETLSLENIF